MSRNVFRQAKRELGLSEREYQERLQKLLDKMDLLKQALDGEATVTRVHVKRYRVPAFWVKSHDRLIINKPKPKAPRLRIVK